jgi:hypothetical protein
VLLDLRKHLIEGIREQPQLIAPHSRSARGIVTAIRHGASRVGEREDRSRDLSLEHSRQLVGDEKRHRDHHRCDAAVDSEPLIQCREVGLQVQRAKAFRTLMHRLQAHQSGVFKVVAIRLERTGQRPGRQVRRIGSQQCAPCVIEARGDDVPLGLERIQNLSRILLVFKGERGRTVGRNDLPDCSRIAGDRLPERQEVIGDQGHGAQEQHRCARQQDHDNELASDRRVITEHSSALRRRRRFSRASRASS